MNLDQTRAWADAANNGKEGVCFEPNWSWDCGLKLDFDGGLLRVSSRFYQDKPDIFSGSVSFYIGDDEVFMREFTGRQIDILKSDVEQYVSSIRENIKELCRGNLAAFVVKQEE